jgi:hypothetical protein
VRWIRRVSNLVDLSDEIIPSLEEQPKHIRRDGRVHAQIVEWRAAVLHTFIGMMRFKPQTSQSIGHKTNHVDRKRVLCCCEQDSSQAIDIEPAVHAQNMQCRRSKLQTLPNKSALPPSTPSKQSLTQTLSRAWNVSFIESKSVTTDRRSG